MKRKLTIILTSLLFLLILKTFSQWKYSSGGNSFDGKYKAAHVTGKGFEFPYTKPMLYINNFEDGSINFYLSNIGYTGCERNSIRIAFNDSDDIYIADDLSTDNSDKSLFINKIEGLSMFEFFREMQKKIKNVH